MRDGFHALKIGAHERVTAYRTALWVLMFTAISGVAFAAGLAWSLEARAAEKVRVVYPKKSRVDLDALQLEGEIKNPGDFYFQFRPEDKMDSLVKRRKNFHREMLRDSVLIK